MSQLILPQRLQFQMGPMSFDQVIAKLYPRVRGPYFFDRGNGVSGLGDCTPTSCSGPYSDPTFNYDYWLNQTSTPDQEQPGQQTQTISQAAIQAVQQQSQPLMSYNDLLAMAHLQNCDPRDSACVANNVAKQAAVEQYWVNSNMRVPVGTRVDFSALTPSQVNEFYNPTNPNTGGNVVDTTGIMTVSSGGSASTPPVSVPSQPQSSKPNQSVPPTTPLTPMNTGIQKTGQVLQAQQNAGQQQPAGGSGGDGSATGPLSNTLLIVAAVGVGLFLLMGAKS